MGDVGSTVPDAGAAGQVDHSVRTAERGQHFGIPVIEVSLDAPHPVSSGYGQPVDPDHALPSAQQLRHDGVADETGGTRDHNCHRAGAPSVQVR